MKSLQGGEISSHSTLQAIPCNLVLLGAEGVGKTAIIRQFTTGTFHAGHVPTTLETMIHHHKVDDDTYRLHLCDCSGSSDFAKHRAAYIAEADGIIFVFSTTDKNSLASLMKFTKEVLHVRQQSGLRTNMPSLFIGTGTDKTEQRAVTLVEAERVAASCLSLLNVRRAHHSKRKYKPEKLQEGLPFGVSPTHPLLEITCVSPFEVTRAVQGMIRMVRYFRSNERLPTSDVIFPQMTAANMVFPPPGVVVYLSNSSDDDIDKESLVTTKFDDIPFFQEEFSTSKTGRTTDNESVLSESSICTIHDWHSIVREEVVDKSDRDLVIINRSNKTPSEKQCYSEAEGDGEGNVKDEQEGAKREEANQEQQKHHIKNVNCHESTRYKSAWVVAETSVDPTLAVSEMTSYEFGHPTIGRAGKVGFGNQRCPNCRVM
ncbi:Small GTPase [Trypanosoma melophagium]|uniref:Small GTPase n=1 Tax=Trypanosoma melophagium TaxID=715481 RepID=UPI00351A2486|nr:Small GTPase [Trypanosoma melophagium]